MTAKSFLTYGGVVLLILGILGYLMGDARPFGSFLTVTAEQNLIHTLLGIIALLAAYYTPSRLQRWMVIVIGLLLISWTIWGFFGPVKVSVVLNLLHLGIGFVALWTGFRQVNKGG